MPANTRRGDLVFDCIVERPRSALLGGPFAIIVALLLLLIALAAAFPVGPNTISEAGTPIVVRAA